MPTPHARTPCCRRPSRIFDLSLGQMLWSRRSVFLGVLLGGPVLLAVALRIVDYAARVGLPRQRRARSAGRPSSA